MNELGEIVVSNGYSVSDLQPIWNEPLMEPDNTDVRNAINETVNRWKMEVGENAAKFVQCEIQFQKPGLLSSSQPDKDKSMQAHQHVFSEQLDERDVLGLWTSVYFHKYRLVHDLINERSQKRKADLNTMIEFCGRVEEELAVRLVREISEDGNVDRRKVSEKPESVKKYIETRIVNNTRDINDAKLRGATRGVSERDNQELITLGAMRVNLTQAHEGLAKKYPNLYKHGQE